MLMHRTLMLIPLLATLAAGRGVAQGAGVTVRGVRGLSFGTVLPGVPMHTLRTDPVNSGQFEVRGPPPKLIQITFTLPTVLNGPAGATMTLTFATNDAGFSAANTIGSQVAFNPNQAFATALVNNRVGVFLGGTVSPAGVQPAGSYTGTVVLSVVVL